MYSLLFDAYLSEPPVGAQGRFTLHPVGDDGNVAGLSDAAFQVHFPPLSLFPRNAYLSLISPPFAPPFPPHTRSEFVQRQRDSIFAS